MHDEERQYISQKRVLSIEPAFIRETLTLSICEHIDNGFGLSQIGIQPLYIEEFDSS